MPISTSTVFHFTNRFENLVSILEHTFRPHYCLEDLNIIMPNYNDLAGFVFAIPMVSFCDIPLSQVIPHLRRYGNYGIGLSKEWAIKSGLSPVLYIIRNSPLALTLNSIIRQLGTQLHDIEDNENYDAIVYFHNLLSYLKPYEGVSPQDVTHKNRRFYDEREWRFVPDLTRQGTRLGLTKDDFLNKEKHATANDYLWNNSKLSFSPKDIRYIIVRREDEILYMINRIRDIKNRFPKEQVQLLASRIIASGQIRKDF
jgi:hypothetical protein